MASEVSAASTKWRIFWFEIVSGTDRASLFLPAGKQLGSVIIERRRYEKFEYDFALFICTSRQFLRHPARQYYQY